MSDYDRGFPRAVPAGAADMAVDAGLRAFMLGVYNKLALGLVWSAAMAYLTSSVAPVRDLMFRVVETPEGYARLAGLTPLGMIIGFAPLVVLLFGGFALRNPSPRSSGVIYWTIVTLIGLSLGMWVLLYTGTSIALTFATTAAAFGGLSLWGYVTKKDLTGFGSFLLMGLIGLIIASLVNIFLHSGALQFMVTILGVFIFSGLIAYQTQQLKMTYYSLGGDRNAMGVATNYGALTLYINFINLFQLLLQLMGSRR
jgi:FtsH-binding integral membrane protein